MTAADYSAGSPKWSPDGKYLSFTAAKGKKPKNQVWGLNLLGGDAQQLTKEKHGISGYDWSPDSKSLLLRIRDPKKSKKPQPHVIDRLLFKQDYVGYLDNRRAHYYTFKLGDSTSVQITSGNFDDSQAKWNLDGKSIVFVSNRSENADLNYNTDLWLVSTTNKDKGASAKKLTTNPLSDSDPNWSPDGKSIVYLLTSNEKLLPFSMNYLAVLTVESGKSETLLKPLDRRISAPQFSEDGANIFFTMQNEGTRPLMAVGKDGENLKAVFGEKASVYSYKVSKNEFYTLHTDMNNEVAIFKVKDGVATKLSNENKELLAEIELPAYEKISYPSKDSTMVDAFLIKPNDFDAKKKYPMILWIHGGPTAQYSYTLRTTARLFAAQGYVVLLVNPRGSTGYGEEFCSAIFADWGNKDYDDVMSGVDYVIDQGYVDEDRLGVGGWSYGGILTNYVITKTTRFKAAMSGAGLGLYRANYGHDMYLKWYNSEFGTPWENKELWERLSPYNQVEKITTPTLWMGGAHDWNVPIINCEQMYLAMKQRGIETQLVVYPNEGHGIRRPTFQVDRFQRWIDWYDKYLK